MSEVKLHSASENPSKFIESPLHKVHWVKCPKCGESFWVPLFVDRLDEYVEEILRDFQEYLSQNPCSEHP